MQNLPCHWCVPNQNSLSFPSAELWNDHAAKNVNPSIDRFFQPGHKAVKNKTVLVKESKDGCSQHQGACTRLACVDLNESCSAKNWSEAKEATLIPTPFALHANYDTSSCVANHSNWTNGAWEGSRLVHRDPIMPFSNNKPVEHKKDFKVASLRWTQHKTCLQSVLAALFYFSDVECPVNIITKLFACVPNMTYCDFPWALAFCSQTIIDKNRTKLWTIRYSM